LWTLTFRSVHGCCSFPFDIFRRCPISQLRKLERFL
jgi:hypothetical protein